MCRHSLIQILNSRWVSSSRDIVALRQTLNNPESCLAFRKFVALKGETYENDVLFWIEIQKYKVGWNLAPGFYEDKNYKYTPRSNLSCNFLLLKSK